VDIDIFAGSRLLDFLNIFTSLSLVKNIQLHSDVSKLFEMDGGKDK